MYVCPNCNVRSEQEINFCPNCGGKMELLQEAPIYIVPAAEASAPEVKKPHLAKKIVGMALSAVGLATAIIGGIYTFIYSLIPTVSFLGMVFALIFGMESVPCSIIGLVFSKSNIELGDTSALSRVGKILGIIGIIAAGVSILIGFAGLGNSSSTLYY